MTSIDDINDAWHAALEQFVFGDAPALHIHCDAQSEPSILEALYACVERHPAEQSYFVLRSPVGGARSWELRADELLFQLDVCRHLWAERGIALPPFDRDLLRRPDVREGLPRFARVLAWLAKHTPWHPGAWVAALVPVGDTARDREWETDVALLVAAMKRAGRLRLVVAERGESTCARRLSELGAVTASVMLPRELVQRAIRDLLWARAEAPLDATGHRVAGCAGPRVAPPPRPSAARRTRAAAALPMPAPVESDPEVRFLVDRSAQARSGRAAARAAALAMDGRFLDAVAAQGEVVGIADEAGAPRAASSARATQLVFLLGARDPERVRCVGEDALRRADECGAREAGQQILRAMAMAASMAGRHREAAEHYRQLASRAREEGAPLVAIDALSARGDAFAKAEAMGEAIAAWRDAVDLAESLAASLVPLTTAPRIARHIAEVCRRHGLRAQADEFEARAGALEHRAEGVAS